MRQIVAHLGILITAMALLLASAAAAQSTPAQPALRVTWVGEFIDPDLRPVSGVFPVTLRLFADASSTTPLWSELRYVSVVDGTYRIVLGDATPLPDDLRDRSLSLGVSVESAGEVTRTPIRLVADAPRAGRAETLAGLDITWADLAERAVLAHEAERAEDCATLDGRTLAQIDRYDELLAEIVRARERLDQVRGAALTNQTVTLERIGGAGGTPYQRTCPPGHVVVGMRGGAGALVDSLELVCARLQ